MIACFPRLEIVRINQRHLDRELLERVLELRDRAAVEMRRRDHFIAGRKQRHQRDELRRHAAGDAQRAGRAFERGDAAPRSTAVVGLLMRV